MLMAFKRRVYAIIGWDQIGQYGVKTSVVRGVASNRN